MVDFVSPFYPFRNTLLTFEVEDRNSEVTDSSGNTKPGVKTLVLEAYMKPIPTRSMFNVSSVYPGVDSSDILLQGYLVEYNDEQLPRGIFLKKSTIKCVYKGVEGTFINSPQLQSSVGAERYTGNKITGYFKISGGS